MSHKLPEGWREESLSNITNIIVSNVDKKSSSSETPVTLCNYMDVYNNSYIDKSLNFMTATATKDEINKFSLKVDDVLITKDSETPEDIAIPAVVSEVFDNFVCGYHLAILRPNNGLSGRFLNNVLMSNKVHNHFVRFANGATRFGLTLDAIKKARIPLPPIEEQRKIAEILGTVDDKISNIDQQISATETLKKGLMQKLFTEGIGHTEFKSTEIGILPKSWEVKPFGANFDIKSGIGFKLSEYSDDGLKLLRIDNVSHGEITWDSIAYMPHDYINKYPDVILSEGDILLALNRPITQNKLKIARVKSYDLPSILYQRVGKVLFLNDNYDHGFTCHCLERHIYDFVLKNSVGSDQPFISLTALRKYLLPLPPLEEQQKIASILTEVDNKIESLKKKKEKYTTLKTGLMQQLLTGQKRVKI